MQINGEKNEAIKLKNEMEREIRHGWMCSRFLMTITLQYTCRAIQNVKLFQQSFSFSAVVKRNKKAFDKFMGRTRMELLNKKLLQQFYEWAERWSMTSI